MRETGGGGWEGGEGVRRETSSLEAAGKTVVFPVWGLSCFLCPVASVVQNQLPSGVSWPRPCASPPLQNPLLIPGSLPQPASPAPLVPGFTHHPASLTEFHIQSPWQPPLAPMQPLARDKKIPETIGHLSTRWAKA